uniref:Inactive hydroxysteroid dehydrogenase-like protein 1 n=2 Tax=Photinus pyralis TaxID=7054 RepID=A0A1Y1M4L3_PHOPY
MAVLEDNGVYVFATIGVISIFFLFFDTIYTLLQLIHGILAPYFAPKEVPPFNEKFGPWALITGATDGIGKAYSKELANRGLNIVLVSRSEPKLQVTAKEIESQYKVKVKIITADFSNVPKAIEAVKRELGELPIGILVNNVGKQYTYPTYLGEVPEQELWDIININIGAVTLMTRFLVTRMQSQGRGAIVNISSGAECQPMPLMNVYAATKVYVKHFTAALREEYASYGITVQHLSPYFVNTKMNDFSDRLRETSLLVPDASTYVKYAVYTLGKINDSTGYWAHGIQVVLCQVVC